LCVVFTLLHTIHSIKGLAETNISACLHNAESQVLPLKAQLMTRHIMYYDLKRIVG